MATFYLKVLTADKDVFEGKVDRFTIRTVAGDVCIMPRHTNYVAPIGIGALTITQDGVKRVAAVSRGFIDVREDGTTIIARTCEWVDEIDVDRAHKAQDKAQDMQKSAKTPVEIRAAELKLKKAINRIRLSQL